MAPAQSKRQSRKRRKRAAPLPAAPAKRGAAPRGVVETERAGSRPRSPVDEIGVILTGRTYGERPLGFFAPVPVSEVAILAGAIGTLVGWVSHSSTALIVGIAVCSLGVLEVTAREHFAGYRSHAMLLAAAPALGILIASVAAFGTPRQRSTRELMLASVIPVFGLLFWLLRKRFLAARQARIVRPPSG